MSKPSEDFRATFHQADYPAAFLEKYEVLECLGASEQGETLLVRLRGEELYRIAKLTRGVKDNAEGEFLSALSHPSLPKLCERICEDDTHILVREFVRGTPLDEAVADRRMSEKEAIDVAVKLCDVLSYLHTQNPPVIHRDVKPQNVILGADGQVTLIDFGIARTYKQDAKKDTVFSGTNDFAPPEQYGFSQTDARADVFSLGMLLRFLLTGGELDARIESRRLRHIVDRCTAFAPHSRYASAARVKHALRLYAHGVSRRWAIAATLLAAFLCGAVVGRYLLPYTPRPEQGVVFAEPVIEQAVRAVLGRPDGALTPSDLARVNGLYIVQDTPVRSTTEFWDTVMPIYQSGEDVASGSITALDDLLMLPNLTQFCIAGGRYIDLSPLAQLTKLEYVELRKTVLTDISPLAGLPELWHLAVVNADLKDITAVETMPKLRELDLTSGYGKYDPAPLETLGDMNWMSLNGSATAYQYLQGKRIAGLEIRNTEIETMEPLATVTGLWSLDVSDTPLKSLEGIQVHEGLNSLFIANTAVTDLSPLLALPKLSSLTLSSDMDVDVSQLVGKPGLSITWR